MSAQKLRKNSYSKVAKSPGDMIGSHTTRNNQSMTMPGPSDMQYAMDLGTMGIPRNVAHTN